MNDIVNIVNNLITKDNVTMFFSLIGAAAWMAPYVFERKAKPEIKCIPTTYLFLEDGQYTLVEPFTNSKQIMRGTIFMITFTIVSLKNDFSVKDIRLKVKFKSNTNLSDAHIYFVKNLEIHKGKDVTTVMNDAKNNFLFQSVLRKNEIKELELFFIVEENKHDIEYLEITFVELNKKKQVLKIYDHDFRNAESI